MKQIGGAYIDFVDGEPITKYIKPVTKLSVSETLAAAANLPYIAINDTQDEKRFEGRTNIEVSSIRLAEKAASGNLEAVNQMLDRILGKPKQETQNLNVNVTYQDYLDKIADMVEAEENKMNVEVDNKINVEIKEAQLAPLAISCVSDYPNNPNLEGI